MFTLAACCTEPTFSLLTAQSHSSLRQPGVSGSDSYTEYSFLLFSLWSLVNLQMVYLEICLSLQLPSGECDFSACIWDFSLPEVA